MAGVAGRAAPGVLAVRAAAVAAAVLVWLVWLLPGAARAEPGDGGGGGNGGGAAEWSFAVFTAQPAAADYADRTVTLAGRLARHGQDGLPRPAAGETVDLVTGAADGAGTLLATVRTGPGGGFLLPDAPVEPPQDASGPGPFTVPVRALHRTASGGYGDWDAEADVDVAVTPSAVRLTAGYTLGAPGPRGSQVTVSGLVERAAGGGAGGWLPVAGVAVRVGYAPGGAAAPVAPVARTVRTGADGRFTAGVAATADGTASVALVDADDPYLDLGAAAPRALHVALPAAAPTPSPAATTSRPARHTAPATHAPAAATAPAARHSATAGPAPATTPPAEAERPADLAVTGADGFTREAFLTGGCTLIAAGLLLAAARRRLARAG
jgi:hypothetical protein